MKFITINTERLVIRCLRLEDAHAISSYRSKNEVARFQSWNEYSIEKAEELITDVNKSSPDILGQWFQFGIELRDSGVLIGDIGVLNTDESGCSWIGFTLDSLQWKKGYAKEGVSSILSFYSSLGVSNFWASTDPENTASRNLLEQLGFSLVENKPDDSIYQLKKINPEV